jgi:serine/threonine-protein kinase
MPTTKVLSRALEQTNLEPFGRYQLLGRIASGGMAEIYAARLGEVPGLQTLVAVKRILPVHATDETFVRLFQREARILLMLQHAGIARVFEVGRVGDHWFLAMELVQGETLAQVNRALAEKGQAWDANLVAYIGAEVAHALHHAHTLRDSTGRPLEIVHRDVSPQNIMLGFDGSVKVIDFGIARWEAPTFDSRTSGIRGKMQYVSPEQARGFHIDGRSDIFSLGAVLYELLDGGKLFNRGTTTATLEAVVLSEVKPLPAAPPKVSAALLNALEKDPDRRYKSAAAFAQSLVRALDEDRAVGPEDVAAVVSSLFPERLRRWRQIHEMAAAGVGFSDVFISAGGAAPEEFESAPTEIDEPEPASFAPVAAEGEYMAAPVTAKVETPLSRRRWALYGGATAAALGAGLLVGGLTLEAPQLIAPREVHSATRAVLPLLPPTEWVNMPFPPAVQGTPLELTQIPAAPVAAAAPTGARLPTIVPMPRAAPAPQAGGGAPRPPARRAAAAPTAPGRPPGTKPGGPALAKPSSVAGRATLGKASPPVSKPVARVAPRGAPAQGEKTMQAPPRAAPKVQPRR